MKFGIQSWILLSGTVLLCQAPTLAQGIPAWSGKSFELAQMETSDRERLDAIQLYNAGVDKLTSGDYQGAIADFTAALAIDGNDADSFYNRGYSYHVLGQYQAAFDDYGRAVDINPQFADAYGNRCYAAYLLKNYEAALANCESAIALKDTNPDFFINRGNAYDDLAVIATDNGNATQAADYHAKAIADYDAALALRPDHAKAYYNRAIAHNRLGNNAAALADYSSSLQYNPNFAEAYFNRGITYYNLGDINQAIADLNQAAQIFGQQNQTTNRDQALGIIKTIQP
jgi:tetratricopeptide (TPR) repeat protein